MTRRSAGTREWKFWPESAPGMFARPTSETRLPPHDRQAAGHELGTGATPTGTEEPSDEVRAALATLLTLAETLDEIDLDDVEPAFSSLEWP